MKARGGSGELVETLFVFGHEEDVEFAESAVGSSAMHHKSQVRGKAPVDLKRRKVRSMSVASVRGLPPAVATHCTLWRHSQRVLMGSEGVQSMLMLAQLVSSSVRVMVP